MMSAPDADDKRFAGLARFRRTLDSSPHTPRSGLSPDSRARAAAATGGLSSSLLNHFRLEETSTARRND